MPVTAATPTGSHGEPREAETALILSYAPMRARVGAAALLALDATFGGIVRHAREPMVAQMRLTWWDEALHSLDRGDRFAEPVLDRIAGEVVPLGIEGAQLARMIDGWEPLLDPASSVDALTTAIGVARGGGLFAALARVTGSRDPGVADAGAGWALADAALRLSDVRLAGALTEVARRRLDAALAGRWSPQGRMLGAMALAARSDLSGGAPGQLRRVARLAWHRLTGR